MEQKQSNSATDGRGDRKVREGVVVSDKMNKTRVVLVSWHTTHPRYHKVLKRTTRFHAHDEKNEAKTGDRGEIAETRPLSRLKNWRIVRILGKGV